MIKIYGEIVSQSWPLLTPFYSGPIVHCLLLTMKKTHTKKYKSKVKKHKSQPILVKEKIIQSVALLALVWSPPGQSKPLFNLFGGGGGGTKLRFPFPATWAKKDLKSFF